MHHSVRYELKETEEQAKSDVSRGLYFSGDGLDPDQESAFDSKITAAKRHLFGALYVMIERTKTKRKLFRHVLLPTLLVTIDWIQLLSLCSSPGWSSSTTSWLRNTGDVDFAIFKLTSSTEVVFFWLIVTGIIAGFVLLMVVASEFRAQHFQVAPIQVLRLLARVLVLSCYIPALKILANNLVCDGKNDNSELVCSSSVGVLYLFVSVVSLVCLVSFAILVSLIYYDSDPLSFNVDSSTHGRFRFIYVLSQTAVVFLRRFLFRTPALFGVVLGLMTFFNYLLIVLLLPYHRLSFNRYRAALFAGATWFATSFVIMTSIGSDTMEETTRLYVSSILIIVTLPVMIYGSRWPRRRFLHLTTLGRHYLPLDDAAPFEKDLPFLRWWSRLCRWEWFSLFAPLFSFLAEAQVEIASRFLSKTRDQDAVQVAETLFSTGIQLFPESAYLRLAGITMNQAFKVDYQLMLHDLTAIERLCPALDFQFLIELKRRDWERTCSSTNIGQRGMNFVSVLEFRQLYEKAKLDHKHASFLMHTFWSSIAKKMRRRTLSAVALRGTPQKLAAIDRSVQAAKAGFEDLRKRFPNSKPLLRSYAMFLEQIMNEPLEAQALYARADEIEEAQTKKMMGSQKAGPGDDQASCSSGLSKSSGVASNSGVPKDGQSEDSTHASRPALAFFKPKTADVSAVKKMRLGLFLGLNLAGVLACVIYALMVLVWVLFPQAMFRSGQVSDIVRNVIDIVDECRQLQLAAISGRHADVHHWKSEIQATVQYTQGVAWSLNYGFRNGIPGSTNGHVHSEWFSTMYSIRRFVPGPTHSIRVEVLSLWDVLNVFTASCEALLSLPASAFTNIANDRNFRFVFDNGLPVLANGLDSLLQAYEKEIATIIVFYTVLLGTIIGIFMLLFPFLRFFVFGPAFATVRKASTGVNEILLSLPPEVLEKIRRHYKLIDSNHAVTEDIDSGEGTDNEPTTTRGEAHLGEGNAVNGVQDERLDTGRTGREGSQGGEDFRRGGSLVMDVLRMGENSSTRRGSALLSCLKQHEQGSTRERRMTDSMLRQGEDCRRGGSGSATFSRKEGAYSGGGSRSDLDRERRVMRSGSIAGDALKQGGGSRRDMTLSPTFLSHRDAHLSRVIKVANATGAVSPESLSGVEREERSTRAGSSAYATSCGPHAANGSSGPTKTAELSTLPCSVRVGGENDGRDGGCTAPSNGMRSFLNLSGDNHSKKGGGRIWSTPSVPLSLQEEDDDHGNGPGVRTGTGGKQADDQVGMYGRAVMAADDNLLCSPLYSLPKPTSGKKVEAEVWTELESELPSHEKEAAISFTLRSSVQRRLGSAVQRARENVASMQMGARPSVPRTEVAGTSESWRFPKLPNLKTFRRALSLHPSHRDAPPQVDGTANKRVRDIFDIYTQRYSLVFLVVILLAIANGTIFMYYLAQSPYLGTEMRFETELRSQYRLLPFLAVELYVNDGNYKAAEEIKQDMVQTVHASTVLRTALKTGDSSFGLRGVVGRNRKIEELLFRTQCVLTNQLDCATNESVEHVFVPRGLDVILDLVAEDTYAVLKDVEGRSEACAGSGDGTAGGTSCASVDQLLVLQNSTLSTLRYLSLLHVAEGLSRWLQLTQDEASDNAFLMIVSQGCCVVIMSTSFLLLLIFFFIPMVRRIFAEAGRSVQLLQMIPVALITKVEGLESHYVRVEDAEVKEIAS